VKYIAPVARPDPARDRTHDLDLGVPYEIEVLELEGVKRDHGPRSRRWLGVVVGLAVAVTGYGFVNHVAGPAKPGPIGMTHESSHTVTVTPTDPANAVASGITTLRIDDQALIVTAPMTGATITSGLAVTGAVVVVDATAHRPLGVVHAAVSIGDAVLGCRDVEVEKADRLEVRIPVFPPAFDAPVVLRMGSRPFAGQPGFTMARDLRLDIPSVVGFWDAMPTGAIDRAGRMELSVRGYGPRAAHSIDIAIQDSRGVVVASTSVPLTDDDDCPDSIGGRIFGLGSFLARLRMPAGSPDPWTLVARWRDPATGVKLHFETSLGPIDRRTTSPRPGR